MAKVYIAGPMSGLPNLNRGAFLEMESKLVEEGCAVMNPACMPDGFTQAEYMSVCLPMLMCCDTIVVLSGWQDSDGAKSEVALACKLGLTIMYQ